MKVAAFLCALLASASCLAGTGSTAVRVSIHLTQAQNSGVCVSETLSAGTGATVYVTCDSGQFVDIRPTPGRPFAGVHGGAYRYSFNPAGHAGYGSGDAAPFVGAGTVTALRVYQSDGNDGTLEMLVSF